MGCRRRARWPERPALARLNGVDGVTGHRPLTVNSVPAKVNVVPYGFVWSLAVIVSGAGSILNGVLTAAVSPGLWASRVKSPTTWFTVRSVKVAIPLTALTGSIPRRIAPAGASVSRIDAELSVTRALFASRTCTVTAGLIVVAIDRVGRLLEEREVGRPAPGDRVVGRGRRRVGVAGEAGGDACRDRRRSRCRTWSSP